MNWKGIVGSNSLEAEKQIDRLENWKWFWIFVVITSPFWLLGLILYINYK